MKSSIILFDDNTWQNLLPLTFTKPVALLRVGILTIKEKWGHYYQVEGFKTNNYLSIKYNYSNSTNAIFVNSSVLPDENLVKKISSLEKQEALVCDNTIIAYNGEKFDPLNPLININKTIDYEDEFEKISYPYDIFSKNGRAIESDFQLITSGRQSAAMSNNNNILCAENIFVEDGAEFNFVTINASNGPVYIGKDAKILEGAIIKGPMALCEHSVIKMGAKIYGETTIGPHSKVGGEVMNSVVTGYSNKGHDGYLGNSVLGEWCNLGADTNNSNLKNNYANVKIWNYQKQKFTDTGLQFCGLIMGDHSKSGINTMFNTGTVVGVSANIFGGGFPRNFIPSFCWGGSGGFITYKFEKAIETVELVLARRGLKLSNEDIEILKEVFSISSIYRKF